MLKTALSEWIPFENAHRKEPQKKQEQNQNEQTKPTANKINNNMNTHSKDFLIIIFEDQLYM